MTFRIFGILAAVCILGLAVYITINVTRFMGMYQNHEPMLVERCDRTYSLPGAEDLISIPEEGLLIAAADRRHKRSEFEAGIYWLANDEQPILVSKDAPSTFQPHGFALFESDGRRLLYVISHDGELYTEPDAEHSIEVFEFSEDHKLYHLRSLRFDALRSPNDLVVVDEDVFYFTNDWKHVSGVMRLMEQYLSLPISDIYLYNGGDVSNAANGLNYPNGLAISSDGAQIWVAESRGRRITEFERDKSTHILTRVAQYAAHSTPDNITIDRDGSLLVAGIPHAFAFQSFADGRAETAPSLIFNFDPQTQKRTTVFYDESGVVSGATVGLQHDGRLYIGTAYDGVLLSCPLSG